MRRGFTLIELLVICVILATMVSIGVGSIRAGQGAARVKGATRDIFGAIRHARSTALVTGQPAIVTYSTENVDGEVMAKVEITSAKLFDSAVDRSKVQTLGGELPGAHGRELVHIEGSSAKPFADGGAKTADGAASGDAAGGGETVEEILFAPMSADVVKGMRLKVLKGEGELAGADAGRKTKISVFSNVDYLIGRFNAAKAAAREKAAEASGGAAADAAPPDEPQEKVDVVWESNGRVEPHKVWVYADGQRPEDGLMIRIDRFGAAKVLRGDGKDEE